MRPRKAGSWLIIVSLSLARGREKARSSDGESSSRSSYSSAVSLQDTGRRTTRGPTPIIRRMEAEAVQQLVAIAPRMRELKPAPGASVFYELMSDALVWSDEIPDLETGDVRTFHCLRFVFRYRTTLMLDAPDGRFRRLGGGAQALPRLARFRPAPAGAGPPADLSNASSNRPRRTSASCFRSRSGKWPFASSLLPGQGRIQSVGFRAAAVA